MAEYYITRLSQCSPLTQGRMLDVIEVTLLAGTALEVSVCVCACGG